MVNPKFLCRKHLLGEHEEAEVNNRLIKQLDKILKPH